MEWGPQREFLNTLQQTTGEIPKALKDRPSLNKWTVQYYSAFNVLSDSRQIGQGGIGPIPLSEMKAYMEMFEVSNLDERERFAKMVRALDRVYIKHVNTKLKQDREKAARNAKAKAGRRGKRG